MKEFRVGDLVKVTELDGADEMGGVEVDMLGIVEGEVDTIGLVLVLLENGEERYLFTYQLELLEAIGTGYDGEFNAGDKVRVINTDRVDRSMGIIDGDIGEIFIRPWATMAGVTVESGNSAFLCDDQIELIDDCYNQMTHFDMEEFEEGVDALVTLWSELDDVGVSEEVILELVLNLLK